MSDPLPQLPIDILNSAVRTATVTSGAVKMRGYKGVTLFVNISAEVGAITLTPKVQVKDPKSGTWIDLASAVFAALTGTGITMLTIYPGIAETANVSVSDIIPDEFRVVATMSGTTSMTYTISGVLLP